MKAARSLAFLAAIPAAACAAPDDRSTGGESFLVASVRQARAQATVPAPPDIPDGAPFADLDALRVQAAVRFAPGTELDGVLAPPSGELEALAADGTALVAWLAAPPDGSLDVDDGLALVWLRDPAIRAAREALFASLEGYDQARMLEDVAARYRSFARTSAGRTRSQIGPYPAVDALRGELVERDVEAAWHGLVGTVVLRLASAQGALAELGFVDEATRVTGDHLALLADLDAALLGRVGAGQARQADLLAVRAESARLGAELLVLAERRRARAAGFCALLDLGPETNVGPIAPAVVPATLARELDESALAAAPEVALASTRLERLRIAVRLAEVMALGPLDFGLADRPVEVGRAGPTEALVREMRARVAEHESRLAEISAEVASAAAGARAGERAAAELRRVHEDELLPLARASYDGLRGSYSSGAASFLDVYRAARRLLDIELDLATARRDEALAGADWMERTGRR